jgi:mutator protein MutT
MKMKLRRNSAMVAATVLVQERELRGGATRAQVLVLKRGVTAPWLPNYWNLPGGSVDPGETTMQAAARECEEEISMVPKGLRPLATYHDPEGWTLETFVTDRWSGEPVVTWESDGYAWVSLDDLPHMRFVPGVRDVLEAVLRAAR